MGNSIAEAVNKPGERVPSSTALTSMIAKKWLCDLGGWKEWRVWVSGSAAGAGQGCEV
jgi:hypothetical protein